MRRGIGLVIWLTVVWVALWGSITVANIVSGLILSILLVLILPFPRNPPAPERFRPWPAVKFAGYFLLQMVKANAIVIYDICTPAVGLHEGVIAVRFPRVSDGFTTLITNSITLTPGTLVLEVTDDKLYIHVLHPTSIEAAREEIYMLIHYALEAFGREDTIAAHERSHTHTSAADDHANDNHNDHDDTQETSP